MDSSDVLTIHQNGTTTVRSLLKFADLHTVVGLVIALTDSQSCGSEETKSACQKLLFGSREFLIVKHAAVVNIGKLL